MVTKLQQTNCPVAYTWHTPVLATVSHRKFQRSKRRLPAGVSRHHQKLNQDAAIEITYPGSQNYSQMTYDGLNQCTKIIEVSGGTTTSTRQFLWTEREIKELRDGAGAVLSKYFGYGQTVSGANYYYTRDNQISVRELTSNVANVQAQYAFDPYGRLTILQESVPSDFKFAGYYSHTPSALNLTENRFYSANSGRWISREPISDRHANLYGYCFNDPVNLRDPSGLAPAGNADAEGMINLTAAEPICIPSHPNQPGKFRRQMPSKQRPPFECCEGNDEACCTENWVDCRERCDDRYRYGTIAHRFCVDCCRDQNDICHQRVRQGAKFGGGNWGRCMRYRPHVKRRWVPGIGWTF